MIFWINGAFGSGKTTLANLLLEKIPNSILFDPEEIGGFIHQTVPGSKSKDFQDYKIWRELVVQYIIGFYHEFKFPLIIPMTLVNPVYIDEIFGSIKKQEIVFHHFYLDIEEDILRDRISTQIIHTSDKEKDEWIKNWRLQKMKACLEAKKYMPEGTRFLDSGKMNPTELSEKVKDFA